AHGFNALHHELKAVSAPFRVSDGLFDVEEEIRIVEFLAQLFDEGVDFRIDEEQLSAKTGSEEQFFVQYSANHERADDAPISANLAQPCVFLCAQSPCNFEEVVSAAGIKPHPPDAGFAHFGFAAEIVEFENQFSVGVRRLFGHES